MVVHELEKLVESKVKPLLTGAMQKNLGITIAELEADISTKLKKCALLEFEVDTKLKFKEAKRKFRRDYIARLIQLNLGNVADVAKVALVDRRSIHRIVAEMRIDVQRLRNQIDKSAYLKQTAVQDIIRESLEHFKSFLNPRRYEAFYKEAPVLSKTISKELPEQPLSLKEAERDFEKRYFQKALSESKGNISKTARKIGIRFETLHRKMKKLGLNAKDLS